LNRLFPDTATSRAGHLVIGGCDVVDLAAEYGTPLYVYDEATVRGRAAAYRDGLATAYPGESLVCYAGKAYTAPWLLKILDEERLGLDVASGGELYVASRSGFPPERVYFHGNNKSQDELRLALELGVHRIVVDNFEEIDRLARLGAEQAVLLRVAPAVEAHTHAHILTGAPDTKFGLSLETGAAEAGVKALQACPNLRLVGLHAHIGSQLFDLEPYRQTIRRLVQFAARMRELYGFELRELSPGGGFGISYTPDQAPIPPDVVTRGLAEAVCSEATGDASRPAITIEPGRSIIGPACVAVYRVGSIKDIPGVRTYVAVDGGMADNIRPATYAAIYSAVLANRMDEAASATVAVAGKYCESGDVLIREAQLPRPRVDDLVAIPSSGAYQLAMASNYNQALRPAVVVVNDCQARLVRRRERYEDLLRLDRV
jgi:diaminopimelate decarboxylase